MKQLICLICAESAECLYFGAISCRACAAFFRRKVVECRKILQRCEGKCKITARRRNSCAHCRFQTCLKVGMKMTAVMKRFEQTKSVNLQDNVFLSDALTLLDRIEEAYQKLQETRRTTFGLKDDHVPQLANFQQANAVASQDYKLIGATAGSFFESATAVCNDQKKLLYRSFLLKFYLLDCGFKAKDKLFTVILSNGNFADFEHLYEYYLEEGEQHLTSRKEMAMSIMEPYWWKMGMNLVSNVFRTRIDFYEFLFLTALLYWDYGVQNQSDDSDDVCRKMRSRVMKELTEYEMLVRPEMDCSLRVGEVILLLEALQKAADMMEDNRQMLMICDLTEMHSGVLEVFNV